MSRRSKGPRLYFRAARASKQQAGFWVIRDGASEIGTGCAHDRLHGPEGAEAQLSAYIASKWTAPARPNGPSDPSDVLIDEVLAYYAQERAPTLADPGAVAARLKALAAWWGEERSLAEVKRSTCKAYVEHRVGMRYAQATRSDEASARRVTDQGARRELEELSAAIGFWIGEHPLTVRPKVWLPDKTESSRDALTRSQAAALLLAAMGWRKGPDGRWRRLEGSQGANRRHLRRFLLMGFYTGTRHTVMLRILWVESAHQAWADLDAGMIYRRGSKERDQRTKKRPVVKIPKRLRAHMERWRRLDEAAVRKAREAGDDARVLSTVIHRNGAPMADKIRTGFAGVVADAGLDRAITPHWMRHTAATWLMRRGVEVWEASGYLGMSPTMIWKHYGHHHPDYQSGAAAAVTKSSSRA